MQTLTLVEYSGRLSDELVMRAGRDGQLGEDGIHFTEPGYARIGRAVADVIAVSLAR